MFGALMGIAGLAGSGLSALGQYAQGSYEQDVAEYNAKLMRQRAVATEQAMESETEMMHDRARKLKGQQTAAAAKSGAMISSGTPLMVLAEQSAVMERDILEHRRSRMIEAQQFRSGASLLKMQGKQAKRAGTIDAFSTILGGGAKAGSLLVG